MVDNFVALRCFLHNDTYTVKIIAELIQVANHKKSLDVFCFGTVA